MDIYFLCPKCETKFAIDETGAGMIFRCTNCNAKIIVPEPPKPAPAPVVPKIVSAASPIAPPPPVPLSPAVTPAPPPSPVAPHKTKTEKIPESRLPQQPPAAAPPKSSPVTQRVIIPKIAADTPSPPPTAPVAPTTAASTAETNTQLAALEEKLAAAHKSLAEAQRALEDRDQQLRETEAAARAAREESARTISALDHQLAESQKQFAESLAQITALKAALDTAPKSDALESLRRDLLAQQQRVSELQRYEQLAHQLQDQTRQLKLELAERDTKTAELLQTIANLESQIQQTQETQRQKQNETESRVIALATEKAELERLLESHESHIRQLEALAAQAPAASELIRLQEELRQRDAQIADLRRANEELVASSHAQLTELQEQLAALHQQLAQTQAQYAEQLARAQSEIQSLQTAAQQAQAAFDDERKKLFVHTADLQSRAQQLESELADTAKMLAAAAMSGDQRFKQARDELRAVREESNQQIAALHRQLESLRRENEASLAAAADEKNTLAEQNAALHRQLDSLRRDTESALAAANDEKAALQQQLLSTTSQLESLKTRLAESEQKLSVSTEATLHQLQQREAALETLRRQSAHQLAQIADEKSRLAAQLHEATEQLASLRASLESAQREKSAIAEKLSAAEEAARAASADFSAKLKRALDDKAEVQAKLRAAEADLAIAREKLLFLERNPAPTAEDNAPEIAAAEKNAPDSFPPPAPIFSFSGGNAPAIALNDIPEVDDLKSVTPPPLRFKTAQQESSQTILPEARPISRGNRESRLAAAQPPATAPSNLGEIPSYVPRSRTRPSRRLVLLFLAVALGFVGVGFLLWYQFAGYSSVVDAAKFEPAFASATQIEDHTRIGPQPMQFEELLRRFESDVNAAMQAANRGNERRLAEQLQNVVRIYKDSKTLWDLTRQNNNIAPVTDERVRALAANYSLKRFRIPGRPEEFVDGREGVPLIWEVARKQVREAREFVRSHQPPQ
jgi:DNA-directed RNA polymerase subunit RPC12/RpoP